MISASYIPGKENNIADRESRKNESFIEWKLDSKVLHSSILKLNFNPSIDLFASRTNCQMEKIIYFRPDPDAWGVNAFLFDWKDFKFYAFTHTQSLAKNII